ncbi:OmpP1/FadL family transporter [Myxococcota bacterium]
MSLKRTRQLTAGLLLPLLLVLEVGGVGIPEARASGFSVLTFGGRRTAMVSNLAKPDDPTALFHNPAGLADQRGVQIYLFMAGGFMNLEAEVQELDPTRFPEINPEGCGEAGRDACPWPTDADGYYSRTIKPEKYFGVMPYLGVTFDLGFLGGRWRDVVVSAALYAPNFYGAYLPEDAPTAYHIISGLFLVGSATVGFGWRVNRYLAVGADLSYNYMYLSMARKVSLVDALTPPGEEPDAMAMMAQGLLGDIRLDYSGTDHGVGWGLGMIISPTRWFHIGLRYTGARDAELEGDVSFRSLGDLVDPDEFESIVNGLDYKLPKRLQVEMPIPHSLQVGVLFAIGWRVELSVDFRYWFYRVYERQRIVPIYDPADEGEEPFTEESLSADKNYTDSFQITGGILVRPSSVYRSIELMAGFGYVHSPVPNETFSLDTPMLRHFKVTAGIRWRINRHWLLGLAYQCNIYLPIDVTNSQTNPPTNVRGTALGHVPAIELIYTL